MTILSQHGVQSRPRSKGGRGSASLIRLRRIAATAAAFMVAATSTEAAAQDSTAVGGAPPAASPAAASGGVPAADAAAATAGATAAQRRLLDDFIHYVRIARPDLAAANATALFDSGATNADIAAMVDENDLTARVESMLRVGRGMEGVSDLVAEFESRLEGGRKDLSRNPKRVKEAVQMLIGTRRQQILAEGRLLEAGEYAVPELLKQVVEGRDPQLEQAAVDMLIAIRRQAVTPLSVSLAHLDSANQRQVCDILGTIGWPHAGPYLFALAEDQAASPDVRAAALQAYGAVGGTTGSLSEAWTGLSKRYFDDELSLVAFPTEATNNVWGWDDFVGVVPTPVPTPIFPQVMAMTTARNALIASPDNTSALALFVGADLRRENRLPEGETDPIYGANKFSPQFYATAAGTSTASQVLAMGLASYDTPLIRDAIGALADTAGGGNLVLSDAGTNASVPLVEAMRYPDRRVQYEAALTLGNAVPSQSFPGDYSVVPMLASAVRTGNAVFAVVVAQDQEDRQVLASRLQSLGFTVLNSGGSLAEVDPDIAAAPGVDLVVVRGGADFVRSQVAAMRTNPRTVAAPALGVASSADTVTLNRDFENDRRTLMWQSGLGDEQFSAAVDQVMNRTSGGRISDDEAQQYSIEALDTLRTIATANSPVYKIEDAENALLAALERRAGGVRLLVADVLALTNTETAQRRLLDAAIAAKETEQIELLDRVAASARRFGNKVEPRQVEALLKLIGESTGATADAAARVHGALNLPASNAVKLIVK